MMQDNEDTCGQQTINIVFTSFKTKATFTIVTPKLFVRIVLIMAFGVRRMNEYISLVLLSPGTLENKFLSQQGDKT
jgi:hypothetical protein